MELDKNLLQYTISKKVNLVPISDANVEASISDVSKINLYPIQEAGTDTVTLGGSEVNLFGTISDTELVNLYGNGTKVSTPTNNIKFATTYKNFSPEQVSKIKQAIYNYAHGTTGGTGTSGTGGTGGTGTGGTGGTGTGGTGSTGSGSGTGDGEISEKKSFLTDFCDVDTMFEYLETLSGGEVTKDTGITRAQLVHLTQYEVWEDNNYNFWATLNRIFNYLDTDTDGDSDYTNDVLSYDEIKAFIGDELGEDVADYLTKVNNYAKQLQTTYASLSDQGKLEFVIERTKEYLQSAGLDMQLNALNRLTSETDTANPNASAKVGQIVMTEFADSGDGATTLGAYSFMAFSWKYDDKDDLKHPYTVGSFSRDNDDINNDLGITLNKILLNESWYCLVDTLVHELTHATASQWYPSNCASGYYSDIANLDSVQKLYDAGTLTDAEYQYYQGFFKKTYNPSSATEEETEYWNRLMYLLECQWGEYAAYQADADYVDSIAGDIFNKSYNSYGNKYMTTAVSGADEASTITNHIEDLYNNYKITISEFARTNGISLDNINDNDGDGYVTNGDTVTIDGEEEDLYLLACSKESKPDYDWATYNKNKSWSWSA